jgi:hypothetical protein
MKKKGSRDKRIPRSLHIRFFWKTHFINPPEIQGRVGYREADNGAKVSKFPIRGNRKIAQYVPLYVPST